MELKAVGSTPLKVAPIALGGNVFGWTADRNRSFELLDAFVGSGFNCIDTADVYSQACDSHHLAVFPYFALASGFLTGKYRDKAALSGSARGDFVARYLDDRGSRVLAALDAVASARQRPLAQIALAWLLGRPGVTAPIASATTRRQLEEILPAVEIRLRPEEMLQLDIVSVPASASGS